MIDLGAVMRTILLTPAQRAEIDQATQILPPSQREEFLDALAMKLGPRPTDLSLRQAIVDILATGHVFLTDSNRSLPMNRKRKNDNAFDEHGLLKDGAVYRAGSVHLMDQKTVSRPRITDGAGRGGVNLNRPGFRIADRTISQNYKLAAAREDYETQLCDAYKGDAPPAGSYPYTAAAEGKSCTINGFPGTLVKQGNWLVCEPDEDDGTESETSDKRSVDQRMNDHETKMDSIYSALDAEIENAWRTK